MEIFDIKKIFFDVITGTPGIVRINPIDDNPEIAEDDYVNFLSVKKEENNSYSFAADISILQGVNVNNLTRRIYESLLYRFKKNV